MNSCEQYQELISRLVDGEIAHDEYEALMAHMESCSRCSAMYAVFHDLSDLLAEEAEEPLPEGLHENIMAGVWRSAIMKKNRRMRSIGLRTALTAAACAVLVLFGARVLSPQDRAESVSIRSQQAAEQMLPAAPTAAPAPEALSAPAPAARKAAASEETAPVPAPEAEETAPVENGAILPEPAPAETSVDQDLFLTAESAEQEAPVPVLPAAPPVAVQSAEPAEEPTTAAAGATENVTVEAVISGDTAGAASAPAESAPAESRIAEEEPKFTLFGGLTTLFESAPEAAESPEPEQPAATEAPVKQQFTVRGKEQRATLLSLLGEKEEALPGAAPRRSVLVTLIPEDEYGVVESLEIRIYDGSVYYVRTQPDGGSKSYCADCAASALDAFFDALPAESRSGEVAPVVPTPTADPYADVG